MVLGVVWCVQAMECVVVVLCRGARWLLWCGVCSGGVSVVVEMVGASRVAKGFGWSVQWAASGWSLGCERRVL